MIKQRTIKRPVQSRGIGLHSGKGTNMRILPAPIDHGIVFKRIDLSPPVVIPAQYDSVVDTVLSTTIGAQGAHIKTIEHFMSVLHGLGIDNALIEIDEAEVPTMDGSAAAFVFLLQSAGILEQDAPKKVLVVNKKVEIVEQGKWISLQPYDGFRIHFTIYFEHEVIKKMDNSHSYTHSNTNFIYEISRARTFGFKKDVELLQSKNLALGGSLENAAVIGDEGVLNKDGLRFSGELVRHKILDTIGDLYLLGHSIVGELHAYCSGHDLNNKMLRALQNDTSGVRLVALDGEPISPNIKEMFA